MKGEKKICLYIVTNTCHVDKTSIQLIIMVVTRRTGSFTLFSSGIVSNKREVSRFEHVPDLPHDQSFRHFHIPFFIKCNTHCENCTDSTSSGLVNCRLCGHGFCNLCVIETVLPKKFLDTKNASQVAHICFLCRDSAFFAFHFSSRIDHALTPRRALLQVNYNLGWMAVMPPKEQLSPSSVLCSLCRKSIETKSCRVCGEFICRNCRVKTEQVPEAFKKTGKPQSRVCLHCRFLILGQHRFSLEEKSLDISVKLSPRNKENDEAERSSFSSDDEHYTIEEPSHLVLSETQEGGMEFFNESAELRRRASSLTLDQKWKNKISSKLSKQISIPITLEGAFESLTTISCNDDESLEQVHEKLLLALPDLKEVKFCFLCRGLEIPDVHRSIYGAKFFHRGVELRLIKTKSRKATWS